MEHLDPRKSKSLMKGTPHQAALDKIITRSEKAQNFNMEDIIEAKKAIEEKHTNGVGLLFKGALATLGGNIDIIECKYLNDRTIMASTDLYNQIKEIGSDNRA